MDTNLVVKKTIARIGRPFATFFWTRIVDSVFTGSDSLLQTLQYAILTTRFANQSLIEQEIAGTILKHFLNNLIKKVMKTVHN